MPAPRSRVKITVAFLFIVFPRVAFEQPLAAWVFSLRNWRIVAIPREICTTKRAPTRKAPSKIEEALAVLQATARGLQDERWPRNGTGSWPGSGFANEVCRDLTIV